MSPERLNPDTVMRPDGDIVPTDDFPEADDIPENEKVIGGMIARGELTQTEDVTPQAGEPSTEQAPEAEPDPYAAYYEIYDDIDKSSGMAPVDIRRRAKVVAEQRGVAVPPDL